MANRKDIQTIEDIQLLVDTFYSRIQQDDMLGIIFNQNIQDRWPEHLNKMYSFWHTILLEANTYHGRPFPPHAHLPIKKVHFDHWLLLFTETIDRLFVGEKTEEAKWRAHKMATMFLSKLDYIHNNPNKPLLL